MLAHRTLDAGILAAWIPVICFSLGALGAAPICPVCQHPQNGHYFLWRGRAINLITSAEHYGAVINRDFDYKLYLKTLQSNSLNYTRIFAGSYVEPSGAFGIKHNTLAPGPGRFLAPWKRSSQSGYAGGGNKFDLDHLNAEYLARLKAFLTEASRCGVVVELTLFCSTYSDKQWAVHPFNPANNIQHLDIPNWKLLNTTECPQIFPYQERLVRWLVTELADFDNVFFEIQNEPWSDNHVMGEVLHPYWVDRDQFPNAVELTLPRSVAWQAKIANVINDAEVGRSNAHLIAQNICNFRLSVRESDLAPHVGLLNFHYAFPQAVRWNLGLGKISGYDETGFAGSKDATYRRQAWRFIMSGGGLFNHLDYSFSVGHEDGSDDDNEAPGGGSAALRKQIGVLNQFVNSFDLVKVRSNNTAVFSCPGASWWVLSQSDRAHGIYLEGRGNTTMHVNLTPGRWTACWIDPATGVALESRVYGHAGGIAAIAVPEFQNSIAVRLTR